MAAEEFLAKLLDYLRTLSKGEITADTELFQNRILDSLKFIEVMAFVEGTLGIVVPNSRLSAEYFQTARSIAANFCSAAA
jgi:acyl carrier protein